MPRPADPSLAAMPKRGFVPALIFGISTLIAVGVLSAIGHDATGVGGQGARSGTAAVGILSAFAIILQGGLFAAAYLLGAIGLGRLPAAILIRGLESRLWLQPALGVGLLLWLSHLLGCAGLLSGDGLAPRIVAWAPVALGVVILLDQMARGDLAPEKWPAIPMSAALAAPALGALLVASANPPGWLWESEYGAYDALSYHLQLPKEWATPGVGALQPSAHNVYSYLPGYVEAAYLHLGQMMLGSSAQGVAGRMLGESGGDGAWVYSCQLLHALMAVLAALLCGRGAWAVARRCGATDSHAVRAGLMTFVVVLSTGWTIVCGSLAYNEMGVLLLTAGALLLCVDQPSRRDDAATHADASGVLALRLRAAAIGLLIGLASSCKPTALLLVGPAAGLLMLGSLPGNHHRRVWPGMILVGSIGGLIALAPWLIRNTLASGNPVFPIATGIFGLGHYTPEQVARYLRAHAFDGPLIDRFAMLFTARGWLHAQWGATPWLALAAAAVALRAPAARRVTFLLIISLILGMIAWMAFTHLQSRFLVPLLAPMSLLLGAGFGTIDPAPLSAPRSSPRQPRAIRAWITSKATAALLLALSLVAALQFAAQRGGAPNALLIGGVAEFTGLLRADEVYMEQGPKQRAAILQGAAGPFEFINLGIRPGLLGDDTRAALLDQSRDLPPGEPDAVYLLGDAASLYYLGATGAADAGVVYHTTWDASPLGNAIRSAPTDAAAWTRFLRAQGIGFVLMNFDELSRLSQRDRNFDPDVTMANIDSWLSHPDSGCSIVKLWTVDGASHTGDAGTPGKAVPRPSRLLVHLIDVAAGNGEGEER